MTRVDLEKLREAKYLLLKQESAHAVDCALAVGDALIALQKHADLAREAAILRGRVKSLEIELRQRQELSESQGWAA